MKGRLILKNSKNEFITADVNVELKDTEGIYSTFGGIKEFDFVGCAWIPEEKPNLITVNCGIDKESADAVREAAEEALKKAKKGSAI